MNTFSFQCTRFLHHVKVLVCNGKIFRFVGVLLHHIVQLASVVTLKYYRRVVACRGKTKTNRKNKTISIESSRCRLREVSIMMIRLEKFWYFRKLFGLGCRLREESNITFLIKNKTEHYRTAL